MNSKTFRGRRLDLLTFSLENERYGIPVAAVDQIHRAVFVSALPGAPAVIEGAINVRGAVVPVIDLRQRFGLSARAVALTDLLILVRCASRTIAIRAQADASVRRIAGEYINAPASVYPHPRFVAGIARLADGLLVIHDPDSFLVEAESKLLAEALAAAEGRLRDNAG